MVKVDTVVVTRDTRDLTLSCVRSALAERGSHVDVAVWVVDNASSDGTTEAMRSEKGPLEVIENQRNEAYGRACNQGAAAGAGKYILILNSDIIVREGSIVRLVETLERSSGHVAVGGRIVDPGTDSVQVGHAARRFPTLATQAAQMVGLERKWPSNPVSRRALGFGLDYELTQDVDQPPGSCLLIRRSAFETVGGFDEGFFYWYEDVDICRRLWDLGQIAYVHDAPFEHVGGATFSKWSDAQRAASWYPGIFRYFAKHRPRHERVAIRALAAILAALRGISWLPRDPARARVFYDIFQRAIGLR